MRRFCNTATCLSGTVLDITTSGRDYHYTGKLSDTYLSVITLPGWNSTQLKYYCPAVMASDGFFLSLIDLNDQDSAFSQCSLGQIFLLVGNSNIPLPSAPSPALLNPHSQLSTISGSWVALSESLGGGGGWGLLPQPWFFELSRVTNSTVLPKNGLALKEVCKDEKILRTHYLKKES